MKKHEKIIVRYARADVKPMFVTFDSALWSGLHAPDQCRRAVTAKPCGKRYNQIIYEQRPGCLPEESFQEARDECDAAR